jgi:hypothetical protein
MERLVMTFLALHGQKTNTVVWRCTGQVMAAPLLREAASSLRMMFSSHWRYLEYERFAIRNYLRPV